MPSQENESKVIINAGFAGKRCIIKSMKTSPGYSMPKGTGGSMLALVEKRAKATPGPDEHHNELSWNGLYGNFGVGTKGRKTFCDDAIKEGSKQPCPTEYNNEQKYRDKDGQYKTRKIAESKAFGVNYLSDHEFKGATTPGPERYFEDDDACTATTKASSRVRRHGSNVTLRLPYKGL